MPAADPARRPPLLLLALASSLSPFGMAVVLPAVAAIAATYGVDYAGAQFVLSAYLVGLGVTQPFSGILCDRLGRRPVLLGGAALFLVASVGCALAPTLPWLVVCRLLQAVGISVGTVASRAMIRDTHDLLELPRALARLAAAMGVAPIVAPVIGGAVGSYAGPAGVFAVTAALAAVVLAWLGLALRETLPATGLATGDSPWSAYAELLRSPRFVSHTLLYGFLQGAFFAFLAVGAAVFERDLGLGQQEFGLVWGGLGVAYVVTALLAGRWINRFGAPAMLRVGAMLAAGGGAALLAGVLLVPPSRPTVLLPLLVMMLANGLITPLALAGAAGGRAAIAGTAAGLSSAAGLVMTGAYAVVSGFLYQGSLLPVAVLVAQAALCTALLVPFTGRDRWRG